MALQLSLRHVLSINLLYLSTSLLWWQAVAAIIGVTLSNTLRNNARCTWRPREGSRNVHHAAIRHAISPLRPGVSVTADVHGLPPRRGTDQAPSRDLGHPGHTREKKRPNRLTIPRDVLPTRPSSFRLL